MASVSLIEMMTIELGLLSQLYVMYIEPLACCERKAKTTIIFLTPFVFLLISGKGREEKGRSYS